MDTQKELYEAEASGWQRGLYEDIKLTFRAPIVNWIFRTMVANHPDLTRHLWSQVKPVFETRGFGRTAIAHRAAVYEELDVGDRVDRYRCGELDVSPAEFRELQGQLATYDVVSSRLAVFFEVADRSLNGGSVGTSPDEGRAACEPLPASFDRDRGRPPTMIETEAVPPELEETITSIRAYHGLDSGFPSIYRTMAQWPGYLGPMWTDLEPTLRSGGFESAVERSATVVEGHVEKLPYTPQITPSALEGAGFDAAAIEDFADLFETFNRGPIEKVLPALPVFAYTVDAEGPRTVG